MQLYHLTPPENLASIAENGLIPKIGPRSKEFGETESRIYAFNSADDLQGGIDWWLEDAFDSEDPLACLLIDIEGLRTSSDVEWETSIHDIISPDRIQLLSMDIWEEYGVPGIENAKPLSELA